MLNLASENFGKTIGEKSVYILGYTNTNYLVDDCNWIQQFTKCSFQIVFS